MKKRQDGLYQKKFRCNGKQYIVYGHSTKELSKKEREKRAELDNKMDTRNNPTLDQYHKAWEEELSKTVKASTIKSHSFRYKACASIKIKSTGLKLGEMKLRDITTDDIREVQKGLQNAVDDKGNPIKRTTETVNNDIAHLSHIFHTAVLERKIPFNPCDPVKNLKRTEPEARDTIHRALTDEEITNFFKEAEKSFYYDVYRIALATGLRAGEIGAITHADIKDGFIHISKTVTKDITGGAVIGDSPKTAKGVRQIPLNDTIKEIINHQKSINTMLDGDIISISDCIFKAPERGLLVVYPVDREIARICKRIGIERFSMHAFRATFATRCIREGVNPRTLQDLLGHKHYDLTMSLYGHTMDDSKIEAMEKVKNIASF